MSKSSINFKAVKSNSETHNTRVGKLDYVHEELTDNNENFIEQSISERLKEIQESCKKISGRKLQKNATPIREAVVNLNSHHTMKDLKKLTAALEDKFKIKAFQIHIHKDEGKTPKELNYHAHIVFDWQDKNKGSMLRLNKLAMSQIQTLVSETLGMERGKEGSKSIRLEAQVYKQTQEVKTLNKSLIATKKDLQEVAEVKKSLALLPKDIGLSQNEKITLAKQKENINRLRQQTRDTRIKLEPLQERHSNNKQTLTHSMSVIMLQRLNEQKKRNTKLLERLKALKQRLTNYLKPNSQSLQLAKKRLSKQNNGITR